MVRAGPLSLGQLSVWQDIRELPPERRHEPNNASAWALPPGVGAARVHAAVTAIVRRHPSLRTRYDLHDADRPGQLPPDDDVRADLPVLDAAGADAEAAAAGLATAPFDLGREHGWRARLTTRGGAATHLLFVKHHIAADAWAQELLRREFLLALTDPGRLGPEPPGPAELAAEQRTPNGRRRQQAALRHWAQLLDRAPSVAPPADSASDAGTLQATLRSAVARSAAHAVADRAQVSVASVVLAAYARSVARACGTDALLVQLMSANRFSPRWRNLVTSMNQWVPALVEQVRGDDFAALARAVHWSSLSAFRHGAHDVTAVAALTAGRADAPRPTCAFNYVAVPDGTVPGADAAGRGEPGPVPPPAISWEQPFTTIGPPCYARALESGGTLSVRLTATGLGREQCAELLWDLHGTLLTAAERC